MNKFNESYNKYQILIGIILFIFFMLIVHAFQIMPTDLPKKSTSAINDTIDLPTDNSTVEVSDRVEPSVEDSEDNDSNELDDDIDKNLNLNKDAKESELFTIIEEEQEASHINSKVQSISEIKPENETDAEEIYTKLFLADKSLKDNQLDKAISEYNSILNITSDSYIKLRCYEGIANIYAKNKKYGSAIIYAQKAYNIESSTSIDVLLARLYYQTGDIDKATKRITYVLKKDFK